MDKYKGHSIYCPGRLGTGVCTIKEAATCRWSRNVPEHQDEPLADWERELLHGPHEMGEGNVIFTLTDGRTVKFENVRVDSVTTMAEVGNVVGVEFFNSNRIVHVPFVSFWEFEYDL